MCERKNNQLKAVTLKQEYKDSEQLDHDGRNNEVFEDSSTRVFVFKEVSSLDEDDSCNLGRRNSWCSKLGLVKKIKLSEDGTALISESFEKFCEIHKKVRQKENRPCSSDGRKVPKPHLQPTAERGLKKQQRPTTASKLSDIAANKYPDSIFKVYIPEGNRVIKKKRVVPLTDIKPATPVRSRPAASRDSSQQGHRGDKTPNPRAVGPPMKTKHSITPQLIQNTNRLLHNAGGENSDVQMGNQTVASGLAPKKMTHITDIFLSKEEEKKRIREREVMRKRTMDVVKMAFPLTVNDETKPNEPGDPGYDSEISGDEHLKQKEQKSKSSLKSYSSTTSCGQGVTGKRSVTWGENEWSESPNQRHREKQYQRRKKRVHTHRNLSSTHIRRTEIRSSSVSRPLSGSRTNVRSLKGMMSTMNKRERKKILKCRTQNESSEYAEKNEAIKKNFKNTKTTFSDSYSDNDQKDETDSDVLQCSREILKTQKHVKNKKSSRRCDCGRVKNKKEAESENDVETKTDQNARKSNEIQAGKFCDQKNIRTDSNDSFQTKRTAIIRKHSTKETLAHHQMDDSHYLEESDSEPNIAEENVYQVKRGRSSPSLRKISAIDVSYGSSDSELCFRKDNDRKHTDKSSAKSSSAENIDEKPLRKIFDSSNTQNEISQNELGPLTPSTEKINLAGSKSSRSKTVCTTRIPQQNIEIAETFTEGFKRSKLNMKAQHLEELLRKQDVQQKYLTDEDSYTENLLKEDCIVNLKTVVQIDSKQTSDKAQKSNITSEHCNSPLFTERLSKEYVLVDAYNMVTNSSKSLSGENSSSAPLMREAPMLNLQYDDDKSAKSDVEGSDKKLKLKSHNSVTEISSEGNIGSKSYPASEKSLISQHEINESAHFQKEQLQDDYSKSFKVKSNINDADISVKLPLRTLSSIENIVSGPKNTDSIGTSPQKIGTVEKETFAQHQQPKQISKNSEEKNSGTSEKVLSLLSPKQAEDRKLHLQKMLTRGESVGTSRMANQIMEKWNSTQRSISQRKEKMLASLRDTRPSGTERVPTSESKETPKQLPLHHANRNTQSSIHKIDRQVIRYTEDRLSNEENANNANEPPSYETRPIEKPESVKDFHDPTLEDFETTIKLPGARLPQPYSSTNILDPSDRHLEESLSPYTSEFTPEKPLCESLDSGIIALPFEKKSSLTNANEQVYATTGSDLDEEIPERDLAVTPPIDTIADQTSPEDYDNARSSISDVDSTYGSTRSNASNIELNRCYQSQNIGMNIEVIHSHDNFVTTQSTIVSIPPMRKVQEAVLSQKNNLPKSVSSSRPTSNNVRSTSKRSKASSSGSSRRSVEPTGRPPSRKPQMVYTSDEDSDQEIITSSSPYHVECYSTNVKEPLKKPTSRMYSTLNHAPHPGQESIKTAIRDLGGVKEDSQSNLSPDRPMSSGQCSSRGYQSGSSRPSSGKQNIPKMSPGSVKILKEKSKNSPQRSATPNNINAQENVSESRNAKMSSWAQSTRFPETKKEPRSPTQDIRGARVTPPTGSPIRNNGNEKPPFRYFSRNKNEEDMWNLQKLKNFAVNKAIENYLPPWERVDLTPPESALRERATNEKRLGIKSRITTRINSPQNSGTATPISGGSPISPNRDRCRTPVYERTSYNGRSPTTPRTPVSPSTPVGRTAVGGRTPVECRTPIGDKTPIGCRTPIGGKTANECRISASGRSPIGNTSPIMGRRTPTRNCKPNTAEISPGERRAVEEKNYFPLPDEKHQQSRNFARKCN